MYTVNTKRDTTSYDCCGYQHEILCNMENLYNAYLKAKKGSLWKPEVQKFEISYLIELDKIQQELKDKTYQLKPLSEFIIRERGKIRVIHGERVPDRLVKHCLCDEILMPNIQKYLIYDNSANQQGKGVDFARKRLITHLRRFYMQNGNNGYILLMDYSKYFDNIRHDVLLKQFEQYGFSDVLWLLDKILQRMQIDVSYMTDDEFENCMDILFDALPYTKISKALLTGEKMMPKHLDLGDQLSQVAGIMYPIKIDNYIKIVKGVKFYHRYADDSYIIHQDKGYLQDLLHKLIEIGKSIGIIINPKKTRICRLSDYWTFLQITYSMTETGRIIRKINPDRLVAMRRKMKKLADKLTPEDFDNLYHSWFRGQYKFMSKQQRVNMDTLYNELKGKRKRFCAI